MVQKSVRVFTINFLIKSFSLFRLLHHSFSSSMPLYFETSDSPKAKIWLNEMREGRLLCARCWVSGFKRSPSFLACVFVSKWLTLLYKANFLYFFFLTLKNAVCCIVGVNWEKNQFENSSWNRAMLRWLLMMERWFIGASVMSAVKKERNFLLGNRLREGRFWAAGLTVWLRTMLPYGARNTVFQSGLCKKWIEIVQMEMCAVVGVLRQWSERLKNEDLRICCAIHKLRVWVSEWSVGCE